MWERRTDAKGSGFWPTPQARESGKKLGNYDHKRNRYLTKDGHDYGMGLAQAVQMWPTPRAQDSKHGAATEWELNTDHGGTRDSLRVQVVKRSGMWPTPRARDYKDGTSVPPSRIKNPDLATLGQKIAMEDSTGGQLNPTWVEWLMGWPIGWTDLKPLETDKYQQWLQLHGRS